MPITLDAKNSFRSILDLSVTVISGISVETGVPVLVIFSCISARLLPVGFNKALAAVWVINDICPGMENSFCPFRTVLPEGSISAIPDSQAFRNLFAGS